MKQFLLVIGSVACMAIATSCSPETIDEMNTYQDGTDIKTNPTPTPPTTPPPPASPSPDPNGDRDRDKTHGD